MKRVAKFEKVSFGTFAKAIDEFLPDLKEADKRALYDSISLPKRATKFSAGYDFFSYSDITLKPGETVRIPTGIRCRIDEDYVLILVPRSSLGFKYRLQLDNTVGVIDSDYYSAENEGHIFIKLTNDGHSGKTLKIGKGEGFAQGIFLEYGITVDDEADAERKGGFGSTNR